MQVSANHLLLHDGIADERRTIRLPRINHGLKRLVLIGSDGFISLEALRWISSVGESFLMLDRRGKVLFVTSPVSPTDAKLQRAQSLALSNGTALQDFGDLRHLALCAPPRSGGESHVVPSE